MFNIIITYYILNVEILTTIKTDRYDKISFKLKFCQLKTCPVLPKSKFEQFLIGSCKFVIKSDRITNTVPIVR